MSGARLPLPALQAFEAAARHGSMSRAASELGLSQAAVSYHVRRLEQRLGAQLFTRHGRGLALTEAGGRLATAVVGAFEGMRRATGIESDAAARQVTIASIPIFGTNWLAPRIGDFQARHPEFSVRMTTSPTLGDKGGAEMDADIEICTGAGPFPARLHAVRLLCVRLICVTSQATSARLRSPADLLGLPLIGHRKSWSAWFAAAGVEVPPEGWRQGPAFDSQTAAVQAVAAGNAATLVSREFFGAEIASRRLHVPFPITVDREKHYWLITAMEKRHLPKLRAFRDWITAACAETGTTAG